MKKINEKFLNKIKCGDILGIVLKNEYNNNILYTELTYDEYDYMQDIFYIRTNKYIFRNSNANNNYQEFLENDNIELHEVLQKKKGGFKLVWKKKK
jgi:hypothetical protein